MPHQAWTKEKKFKKQHKTQPPFFTQENCSASNNLIKYFSLVQIRMGKLFPLNSML